MFRTDRAVREINARENDEGGRGNVSHVPP